MKRLQLTDEEVRHIEQRRDNEKRFALGYNQALLDLDNYLDGMTDDISAIEGICTFINSRRKVIK